MSDSFTLPKKTDKELVELLIDGSQLAFGELYARYKGRLIHLCKRYLKSEDDAKDIVQDIFLQLWETRHLLNTELSFEAYLKTLTKNLAMDKLRHFDVHERFAQNMLMNGTDSTNETENTILENDYAKLLDECVAGLSQRQKEIFRLSRIKGHTYKEIAEILNISEHTVKEHASLALKKIKQLLMQHADIHYKTVILLLIINSATC